MKHGILASTLLALSCMPLAGCNGDDSPAQAATAITTGTNLQTQPQGQSQTPLASTFTLSSPDLTGGTFDQKFILNGFGCSGQNISPAIEWSNVPAGTKSLALQVFDPDAPSGSGFWHWAVYDIPPTATGLPQGAGNDPNLLPAGAFGGTTDLFDTGLTNGNGNYGGPCPPQGDAPHRYIFTLYATAVDKLEVAGGVPKTGTAGLYGFVLNKGLGAGLLGKATFTAKFGRP
ncbi:MAG: kinase inhibitor [Herminiimonas sp.]|nr:kinase inhibitor [Herminiimonas sp.]MDB5852423.1 kinase inhibitor [Herminiimonas sp.]